MEEKQMKMQRVCKSLNTAARVVLAGFCLLAVLAIADLIFTAAIPAERFVAEEHNGTWRFTCGREGLHIDSVLPYGVLTSAPAPNNLKTASLFTLGYHLVFSIGFSGVCVFLFEKLLLQASLGRPFCRENVRMLRIAGILLLVRALLAKLLLASLLSCFAGSVFSVQFTLDGVTLPLLFLALSYLFAYGAELQELEDKTV